MRILVLTGSPRVKGNTEIMADEFIRGAKEAGNSIVKFNAAKLNVGPCYACMHCFRNSGICVQKDDMEEILAELDKANMIVFASPIYWFAMSAQIKVAIDRFFARDDGSFNPSYSVLLLNAEQNDPKVFEGAIATYKLFNDYLQLESKGIITIGGMRDKGDMALSKDLEKVYELGKSIK